MILSYPPRIDQLIIDNVVVTLKPKLVTKRITSQFENLSALYSSINQKSNSLKIIHLNQDILQGDLHFWDLPKI